MKQFLYPKLTSDEAGLLLAAHRMLKKIDRAVLEEEHIQKLTEISADGYKQDFPTDPAKLAVECFTASKNSDSLAGSYDLYRSALALKDLAKSEAEQPAGLLDTSEFTKLHVAIIVVVLLIGLFFAGKALYAAFIH